MNKDLIEQYILLKSQLDMIESDIKAHASNVAKEVAKLRKIETSERCDINISDTNICATWRTMFGVSWVNFPLSYLWDGIDE